MVVIYFLLFILLGFNCLFNNVDGLKTEKIINGYLAKEHVWKYVVALMYKPHVKDIPDQNPCSGAIIADSFISTVAHCFFDGNTGEFLNNDFYVVASITNLWERLSSTKYAKVDLVFIPSSYNPRTPNIYSQMGNLAVVKLADPLGLHKGHRFLSKLRIPRNVLIRQDHEFIVASYGWNEIKYMIFTQNGINTQILRGSSDGRLRFADAVSLNVLTCQNEILHDYIAPGNTCFTIIQDVYDQKGICQGDSGAPLFRNGFLIGMAIHGFAECNEKKLPGIYINVAFYHEFIENVLKNNRTDDMLIFQLKEKLPEVFQFEPVFV